MNASLKVRRYDIFRSAVFAAACAMALGSIAPASAADAKGTSVTAAVNINTATVDQLSHLPNVGAKLAARIVEFRKANGSFKKTDELMAVKGIGEKSFERLRPYLSVSGDTTLTEKVASPKRPRSPKAKGGDARQG